MIIFGIDPGMKGGIAWYDYQSDVKYVKPPRMTARPIPIKDGWYNTSDIKLLLKGFPYWNEYEKVVYIEKPSMYPEVRVKKDGVQQKFIKKHLDKLIGGFYLLQGLCVGLGIRVEDVAPKTWQSQVLSGLMGTTKERSVKYVKVMYPYIDLTPGKKTVPHDGMSDALCITSFGIAQEKVRGL